MFTQWKTWNVHHSDGSHFLLHSSHLRRNDCVKKMKHSHDFYTVLYKNFPKSSSESLIVGLTSINLMEKDCSYVHATQQQFTNMQILTPGLISSKRRQEV